MSNNTNKFIKNHQWIVKLNGNENKKKTKKKDKKNQKS